jgi:hypothetical protein
VTRLSVEVRLWIGALLVLQLLVSFVAIGLLARVSPAVDQILRENVYSIEAVEVMLAVLAKKPEGPVWGPERDRFTDALGRVRANVTEPEEEPFVAQLDERAEAALAGREDAREQVVDALLALAEVNRASMREADLEARRLGAAGAWTAALAGLLGAAFGVLVLNRLIQRLVVPVLQVDAALLAARSGDPLRRCVPLQGPVEVVRLGSNLNWMLDAAVRAEPSAVASTAEALRAALLARLDVDPRPTVVVGPDGLLAMNAAAYERVEVDPSPAAVASAVLASGEAPEGWVAQAVVPAQVWICVGPAI